MTNEILVIVESPSKCKKIQSILSTIDKTKKFVVVASCGHFREIKSINKDSYEITYSYIYGKKKYIDGIKKKLGRNTKVYIATDNDREGEAIGWHLCDVLSLNVKTTRRLRFNEISKEVLEETFHNPDTLDMKLVEAQMCRQILDRWIGYKFSPLVSKFCKKRGLSAGRCQTPTLKIISDNENQIRNNRKDTIFRMSGTFHNTVFVVSKKMGKEEGLDFLNENTEFKHELIQPIEKKTTFQYPPKPLTTSKVQQYCSCQWKWSPMNTMKCLQKLYEDGFITYHRTESFTLSKDFTIKGRKWIEKEFGSSYLGDFKSTDIKTSHEAIRPTDINRRDENNSLYHFIWKTTLQSLMKKATIENSIVQITTPQLNVFFEKSYPETVFDGFLRLNMKTENKKCQRNPFQNNTKLKPFQKLELKEEPKEIIQHYNEGQIISKLEQLGIGRPSTFASFISKIQFRNYVDKKNVETKWDSLLSIYSFERGKSTIELEEEPFQQMEYNKIVLNDLGKEVVEYLYKSFSNFFNYEYTAKIESQLDDIVNDKTTKYKVLYDMELELKKI